MRFKLIESISNIHVFKQLDDSFDDIQDWYWDDDGLNGSDGGYGLIIADNRNFKPMFYSGKYNSKSLEDIFEESDSIEESLEKLKELTGKNYKHKQITGYTQSDWQGIYYPEGEFTDSHLAEIEDVYFGMYKNFIDIGEGISYYTFENRYAGSDEYQLANQTGYNEDDIVINYID